MISQATLQRLSAYENEDGVLSVYLAIEPQLVFEADLLARKFKRAVKRFLERCRDDSERAIVERERGALLRDLQHLEPRGRGIAIFSAQPSFREAFVLRVPVPDTIEAGRSPRTAILAA